MILIQINLIVNNDKLQQLDLSCKEQRFVFARKVENILASNC